LIAAGGSALLDEGALDGAPVLGRLQGRVSWADGSPRADVEMRASSSGRKYVTTSDATGAYGLDVVGDVFLSFRGAQRVGAHATVQQHVVERSIPRAWGYRGLCRSIPCVA
jgi:hypothetical protein